MYPERDKRDPSQGLEWLLRNGGQGWQEAGRKWAPKTVWDGEKSRLSPARTLQYI